MVFNSRACRECLHNVYISLQYSCYVVSRCLCLFSNIRYKMFCKAAIKMRPILVFEFTFCNLHILLKDSDRVNIHYT